MFGKNLVQTRVVKLKLLEYMFLGKVGVIFSDVFESESKLFLEILLHAELDHKQ